MQFTSQYEILFPLHPWRRSDVNGLNSLLQAGKVIGAHHSLFVCARAFASAPTREDALISNDPLIADYPLWYSMSHFSREEPSTLANIE